MIGDDVVSSFFDSIFTWLIEAISAVFMALMNIIFVNKYVTIIVFFIILNLLAILLMKKDKQYSKMPDARRIRESTLLITAFVGGALGEYYAMYKYKHKTLHKKFLYGVPLAMVFHFALLSYYMFIGIFA